jgi:Protein of unknown function (DUF3224)
MASHDHHVQTIEGAGMKTQATGKFTIKSWDEKPYVEFDGGGKLTRASVTQKFEGDIEGDGSVEYLMAYVGDGTASFVGLLRVVGQLKGMKGSFILQCNGKFEEGVAKAEWFVVHRSGTGQLKGLRGEGGYTATHDTVMLTLEYESE